MSKVTITTLTPVHVGNGVTIEKCILSQQEVKVGFDLSKFEYLNLVKRFGLNIFENRYYIKRSIPLDDALLKTLGSTFSKNFSIYEHIHTGFGKPYIPGSSLKGAIKTAILTLLFNLHGRNNDKRLSLIEKEDFDFYRFLRVSDAIFEKTKVYEVQIFNIYNGNRRKLLVECIPPKEVTTGTIKLPTDIAYFQQVMKHLNNASKNNDYQEIIVNMHVEEFCQNVNNHTKKLIEQEIKKIERQFSINSYMSYLKNILGIVNGCTEHECVVRVGKHVGALFITGGMYKRKDCCHTRRFTSTGEPLGFIKLAFNI